MILSDSNNFLYKDLCYKIIGCIYEVSNTYGSGQKELVYQNALAELFIRDKITYRQEVPISIISQYSGKPLGKYRLDFVIEDKIIIELKAIKFTPNRIQNQLYSYLYSSKYEVGYLVNFGSTKLFLKRVILTNDHKPYLLSVKSV
jgi:GxxExxY protein